MLEMWVQKSRSRVFRPECRRWKPRFQSGQKHISSRHISCSPPSPRFLSNHSQAPANTPSRIWLIYFIASIEELVIRSLNPYVTSSFSRHSLTAATGIMASIFGGLSKIPLAKILDTWGRPQGLACCLGVWVVGYVMMASCVGVKMYAAAQVFSGVG